MQNLNLLIPICSLLISVHISLSAGNIKTELYGIGISKTSSVINREITRKIEAEISILQDGATLYNDTSASDGMGIAYLNTIGSSFIIADAPKATSVQFVYASQSSGKISVVVNGEDKGDLNFVSNGTWSGSYTTGTISIDVPEGASFQVINKNGDSALNVDYLNFIDANGGGGGTDCSGNCPDGFTLFACGRCWQDEAQAQSGGCFETCDENEPTCEDGVQNGNETGVDCGGSCVPCDDSSDQSAFAVHNIPGIIQVENYDNGGQGVAYNDTNATNIGGKGRVNEGVDIQNTSDTGGGTNIGWIANEEWLEYTIANITTGDYNITFRVASPNNNSKSITAKLGTNNLGTVNVPNTSGWQSFVDVTLRNVQITNSGTNQVLRLDINGGSFNINWVKFEKEVINPPIGDIAYLEPNTGQKLLFIGQDLLSISNYVSDCETCPTPGGVTSYVNLGGVLQNGNYGALGWTENQEPFNVDIDWGGGPLNTYSAAVGFPNSAVNIGLYMVGITDDINLGQLDGQIGHLADFFKSLNTTAFYLRIGYEFDGAWNQYNGSSYINAYKRIVDILRQKGVTNVAYVWQSSTSPIDDVIDGGQENLLAYYPGDDYVDWLGMSWFLKPNETASIGATVTTQKTLGDEIVALARQKGKPLMIAEAANQGYDNQQLKNSNISTIWDGASGQGTVSKSVNQIWDEWYVPFFNFINENDDVIKAVAYINADWDSQDLWDTPYEQGYWGDTRIQVNTTLENNWVNEINQSEWLHGSSNLNTILGLNAEKVKEEIGKQKINNIFIYPNPSKGRFTIQGKDLVNAIVYDINGRIIKKIDINSDTEKQLDLNQVLPGIYLISIWDKNNSKIVKRLVIN